MNDTSRECFGNLDELRNALKTGEYDGTHIMRAWLLVDRAKQLESAKAEQAALIAELVDALDGMIESYEYEASSENPALLKAKEALSKAKGIA